MIKDLTSSNYDIVHSVDYVQALLVTEPVEMLQQIVDTLVHTIEKEILSRYIAVTTTFLKTKYQKHVLRTDDKNKITCPQCMFPYFVCGRIKECIFLLQHQP